MGRHDEIGRRNGPSEAAGPVGTGWPLLLNIMYIIGTRTSGGRDQRKGLCYLWTRAPVDARVSGDVRIHLQAQAHVRGARPAGPVARTRPGPPYPRQASTPDRLPAGPLTGADVRVLPRQIIGTMPFLSFDSLA